MNGIAPTLHTDPLHPYHEALADAFFNEQVRVSSVIIGLSHEIRETTGLDDLLPLARRQENASRHLRQALEFWREGHHRAAMLHLGWALEKGGE